MQPRSAKAKGNLLENHVADLLRDKGIDPKAIRDGASGAGNREKGDIITSADIFGRNLGIECKNQKTLKLKEWWKQVEKLESLGREPILVYKEHGKPLEDSKAVIYLDTLLDLIRAHKGYVEVEVEQEDSNDKRWKIQKAITALKDLLKEYNG